jgi:molybdopterin molybdotransferase
MIIFDEAIELIRSVAAPLGTERVALADAAGCVLASDVIAAIDSPRCDVSAMDGYAVREADLAQLPARLKVVGESFPGSGWDGGVGGGECVRIFTGAPVPAGADRVIVQEIVRREGDTAILAEPPGPAAHVRSRASDFRAGDTLLDAGRLLDPRALVAAAAADVAQLEVFRKPRLRLLVTGDELVDPGSAKAQPNAVPDSISLGLAALAQQWGEQVVATARLRDKPEVQSVDDCDIVVVTGGASVGERDFAKAMFEPLGLELFFAGVSIRPGRPSWLGRVGDVLVVGLPGNPSSAMVTARLLLAPLLCGLTGRPLDAALDWRTAELTSLLPGCGPRETFHRARRLGSGVELLPNQDSGAQKTLADADLLVRQRANSPPLAAGESVDVLDF